MNFKVNSPSFPLGFLLQAINGGWPNSANTSLCNNGHPPIGSEQENMSVDKENVFDKDIFENTRYYVEQNLVLKKEKQQ